MIALKPTSPGWDAWLAWLRSHDRDDLARAAELSGGLGVETNLPEVNSPMPFVTEAGLAQMQAERRWGERL